MHLWSEITITISAASAQASAAPVSPLQSHDNVYGDYGGDDDGDSGDNVDGDYVNHKSINTSFCIGHFELQSHTIAGTIYFPLGLFSSPLCQN